MARDNNPSISPSILIPLAVTRRAPGGGRADANNRYSKAAPIIIRVVLGMIAFIRPRAT
jgi:hypothetical protein